MRALIVEDHEANQIELKRLVLAAEEDCEVKVVGSAAEARRLLRREFFDLAIIDICIPNKLNDDALTSFGFELVEEATWSADYFHPAFVIVVSSLESVGAQREDEGKEGVFYWVHRSDASEEWRDRLLAKLKYVSSVRSRSIPENHEFDVAVLCALEEDELDAVRSLNWSWQEDDVLTSQLGSRVFVGTFSVMSDGGSREASVLCTAAPQMGMPAMAVLTSKVISRCRPRFVFMAGVAGAVRKEAGGPNFGDPLIADMSWDFGSGKLSLVRGKQVLAPDLRPISVPELMRPIMSKIRQDRELLARIRDEWKGVRPSGDLVVHIGPVGSGSAVLAAAEIVKQVVKQHRKMVGFEMETYGLYYACMNQTAPRPIGFLSVKSVMDFGHEEKDDMYKQYAAYTSAQVVKEICEKHIGALCVAG